MIKMNEETKKKIIEALFVIENDDGHKDRYEEIEYKTVKRRIFNKMKYIFGN
ncbi:hypothetical protein [Mammaliicoccus vitulinus]|uniref:Uncharacterized protein n=1 Tax=Mammaliicoccus vitulinus TaxID=71237 RepID=A0ABX7HJ77_9STAP|nr:hypothetical protein [Mammaliicoccus vitulinus]QRO86074.1 hypothetical protein I6J37_05290 [Mammaliicoccus vitulinus]